MINALRGLTHYAVVAMLFSAPVLVMLLPVHVVLLRLEWHGTWYGLLLEIGSGVTSLYLGLMVLTKGLMLLDQLAANIQRPTSNDRTSRMSDT